MPDAPRPSLWLERYALGLCLLAQACLLLARLDLLPVWGDESFTLMAAGRPLAELLAAIAAEKNNPPLHSLLVHFWLLLGWPVPDIVAARALSVLFALAATVVIDRCWLRDVGRPARLWFLLLWTLSPCVLLCARIGRSYSLQVLLFAWALRAAVDLLRQPASARRIAWFAAADACLLYVHYLPGLALLAALFLVSAWTALRDRRPAALWSASAAAVLVGVLYIPWMPQLWAALNRMAQAQAPPAAASPLAATAVRLGYWFFAFNFGETPPLWVLAGAALVVPGVLYLLWKGAATRPAWLGLVLVSAAAGFIGAGRWVSFVFIPARLFFLLPFCLLLLAIGAQRSRRAGWLVCGALVCLSAGSISSYFRKTDFLNKAYLLPYDQIVRLISEGSAGRKAVVVADACNSDPWPLAGQLHEQMPVVMVTRESRPAQLRQQIDAASAGVIWYFRNTHDTSPGGINRQMEQELGSRRAIRRHVFVPYSERDRL